MLFFFDESIFVKKQARKKKLIQIIAEFAIFFFICLFLHFCYALRKGLRSLLICLFYLIIFVRLLLPNLAGSVIVDDFNYNLLDGGSGGHDLVPSLSELDFSLSHLVILFFIIWASLSLIFVLFQGFMLRMIQSVRVTFPFLAVSCGSFLQFHGIPVAEWILVSLRSSDAIGVDIYPA